ncbi:IS256 family transposase [Lujinxingia sediminis]|uniref:IS256 family transposase n=1 Tax=Lujinxingia sediminis TaxID=2480984 RepID=UPI0013E34FC6|nr:IS256 family transposase [Lujinxingia sediminis]
MTENDKKKKRYPKTANSFPEPIDEYLREIAKAAAGKPLSESLKADGPLKQMIGRFVELAYEAEMDEHLGYERNERVEEEEGGVKRRKNTRNGSYPKTLKTSHGATTVRVPRDRAASFEPQIVPKFAGITDEVEARIVSMYARGMTTRDINEHVHEMYGIETNPMFVSRVVERLEPELKVWRNRPLEPLYPIVFIDALHLKVRHSYGVRPTATYQICGYNESGHLEILGLYIAPEEHGSSESASFWHQVLLELEGRGVKDLLIVCADGLKGLEQAVGAVYPKARFQPCVVHLARNSFNVVSYKDRKALAKSLRAIYQATTSENAEIAFAALQNDWGHRYPGVVEQWEKNLVRLASLWSYGKDLRKLVYTTNPIENVHRQLRKVTKSRGAMPNVDSAKRLLTLVAMRINQKEQNKSRPRTDWRKIVCELHIHFGDRLPQEWGLRFLDH